jgi:hypothetical protein
MSYWELSLRLPTYQGLDLETVLLWIAPTYKYICDLAFHQSIAGQDGQDTGYWSGYKLNNIK